MSQSGDGSFEESVRDFMLEPGFAPAPLGIDEEFPRPARRDGADGAAGGLARTIEREIVPMLVETARRGGRPPRLCDEVETLVALLLRDEVEASRALLRDALGRGLSAEVVQIGLLAPAARRLGELWEEDRCEFGAVWLGVNELQRFLRDFRAQRPRETGPSAPGRRILLAATPGEHHIFGVEMVAEFFAVAGWDVVCRPSASHAELVRIAERDWFDVAGFSLGADRNARALADVVRALRRVSFNPAMKVMIGGPALGSMPGVAERVGADWAAPDARAAVVETELKLS